MSDEYNFRLFLSIRINELRSETPINNKNMQKSGVRFNNTIYIIDYIVSKIDGVHVTPNETTKIPKEAFGLSKDENLVKNGKFDPLIMQALYDASHADYLYENRLDYH